MFASVAEPLFPAMKDFVTMIWKPAFFDITKYVYYTPTGLYLRVQCDEFQR